MNPPSPIPASPPVPLVPPSTPAPVLSPEHLQQIRDAHHRAAKIRRAITLAKFDGWATAIFAALTFLGGCLHWIGFLLGAAMATIACLEFRGARRLRRFDPAAATMLAWNQVFFAALLLSYALYSLWRAFSDPTSLTQHLAAVPELAHYEADLQQVARAIALLIYGTLAAVAIFGLGGTALFYASRRKHVEAYLRDTPPWIVAGQRAGLPL